MRRKWWPLVAAQRLCSADCSHSIVMRGLELMTWQRQLMPQASLTMRLDMTPMTSQGKWHKLAVMQLAAPAQRAEVTLSHVRPSPMMPTLLTGRRATKACPTLQ